ncbi:MAG TPA: acyltransferase [Flavisolibacter sp.]|nr:acyltransferase [Flavisolibacter sp.]
MFFFVLSGFLITQILLLNRQQSSHSQHTKGFLLKNFYARRFLRIVPTYLLTLALTALMSYWIPIAVTGGEILAASTFTANFYVSHVESWNLFTVHFWSVAMEEQFYLVWGLLLVMLPNRAILPAILLFLFAGVISQVFYSQSVYNGYVLPQACFHALSFGGMLAWLSHQHPQLVKKVYPIVTAFGLLGCSLIILKATGYLNVGHMRTANVLVGGWLLLHLVIGRESPYFIKNVLGFKLFVAIGKVSYGMYLYHLLYNYVAAKVWVRLAALLPNNLLAYYRWLYLLVMLPPFIWLCRLS